MIFQVPTSMQMQKGASRQAVCQHPSLGETRLAFLHGTEGGQHIQEAGGPVIITGNFRTINEETNSKDAKEQSLSEHIISDTNERK